MSKSGIVVRMVGLVGIVTAPGSPANAQVACGDLLLPGSTTVLTADVGPCDGPDSAILIDSATLDLGGRTLTCADMNGDGVIGDGSCSSGRRRRSATGRSSGASTAS